MRKALTRLGVVLFWAASLLLCLGMIVSSGNDPAEAAKFRGEWEVLVCDLGIRHPAAGTPPARLDRPVVTFSAAHGLTIRFVDPAGGRNLETLQFDMMIGRGGGWPEGIAPEFPGSNYIALRDRSGAPLSGVYLFDGDVLRICWRWTHRTPPPVRFDPLPNVGLLVLRRRP